MSVYIFLDYHKALVGLPEAVNDGDAGGSMPGKIFVNIDVVNLQGFPNEKLPGGIVLDKNHSAGFVERI